MNNPKEMLEAYRAKYPQQVRDLAETLCAFTTRLGMSSFGASSGVPGAKLLALAQANDLDDELLRCAVDEYSEIEAAAAAAFRANATSSSYRASIVSPRVERASLSPGIVFPI